MIVALPGHLSSLLHKIPTVLLLMLPGDISVGFRSFYFHRVLFYNDFLTLKPIWSLEGQWMWLFLVSSHANYLRLNVFV